MAETRNDSPEPAAIQGGSRTPSITSEGKAMNRSLDTEDRVRAVPKAPAPETTDLTPDPLLKDDGGSGYGMEDGTRHPGDRSHKGGDPRTDGDAQYGASPLRSARYQDDHDAEAGIRHHRGVQPGRNR